MTVPDHPRLGQRIDVYTIGGGWVEVRVTYMELREDGTLKIRGAAGEMGWAVDNAVVGINWRRIH